MLAYHAKSRPKTVVFEYATVASFAQARPKTVVFEYAMLADRTRFRPELISFFAVNNYTAAGIFKLLHFQ